jgi:YHS domain-containing protein/thiol-disulfide isomerase/thioredoxin
MRHHQSPRLLSTLILASGVLLAVPALAQEAVHWHKDLESAKVVAKETNRLVLVHFWTPSCGPCMALNQNVFNQPGVASAIEAQFVPVKLNADENSATATWYGITRVPTDVIVTPDGQIVAKLISPPTPAAYAAEMTAVAGKFTAKSGQSFAKASAGAPAPSQLNPAYASLGVSPSVPLAAPTQQTQRMPQLPAAAATSTPNPYAQQNRPIAASPDRMALATPAVPVSVQTPAPQMVNNPAATYAGQPGQAPALAAPGAPAAAAPVSPVAAAAQVNNPYLGLGVSTPPAQQRPVNPLISPAQTTPVGYDKLPLQTAAVGGAVLPPMMPANVATVGAAAAAPSGQPVANAAPDPRQLPPGSPPLAFDGYCPVSMRNSWKWVAGSPQFGAIHRGHTYWFATAAEQKQFLTDPDRFTPALSGMDPVLALDHKQQVPGKREHSLDYDGLFYMFASEATLQQFTANPQKYSTGVRQAMGIPRGRLVR